MNFVIFSFNFLNFFSIFFFCFISFANLKLNQLTHTHIHTENKDINDTIQAGTPQQLAPITAGPGTHKIASFFHPTRMGQ